MADWILHSVFGPGQFMNPGPAPRPPTDRPRLNLTPSTTNLPGNFSQLSLQSTSMRSASTFPSNSSTSLVQSPALSKSVSLDGYGGVAVVKEAILKFKEKDSGWLASSFSKKYVILREQQLDILKTKSKSSEGRLILTIQLTDVTGVSRYESEPLCIEVIRAATSPRDTPAVAIRDLPQKTIFLQFKSDEELYDWQDAIYTRCPTISGVSNPTDFNHRVHVGFDPKNGAFTGLPPEWSRLLNASAITQDDYKRNPEAVIEVLNFYQDINKRNNDPDQFPSLTPTPPVHTGQNMQIGHGGGGTTVTPPRPIPPGGLGRQASYQYQQQRLQDMPPRSQAGTPPQGQRKPSGPELKQDQYQMAQSQDQIQSKIAMSSDMRAAMEDEARRVKQQQEQRDRQRLREDEENQNRKDQEAYNATIPKKSVPIAKMELGGYGGSATGTARARLETQAFGGVDSNGRFNPTRVAPSAPGHDRSRQQSQSPFKPATPQRQDPLLPSVQNGAPQAAPRPPFVQKPSSSRDQSPASAHGSLRSPRSDIQQRQASPSARLPVNTNDGNPSSQTKTPTNGIQSNGSQTNGVSQPQPQTQPAKQVPPVKPLNVVAKAPNSTPIAVQKNNPPAVKQPELALAQKAAAEARQKEVRMSSMSEGEVMEKLKQIVTKQDPGESYTKQKKIGQGASGSVYVAKIREDAASPIARDAYRKHGANGRVAIKTMDLRHQPRKELIVNEIIVMKESMHQNIVNYLDAFLLNDQNELWVVMEYMDAGALTDIIEANPVISEDQIAAICREVSHTVTCEQAKLLILF